MKSKKITFKNKNGDELSARLDIPVDTHPHNFALFAHCFTCTKNLTAINNISHGLTSNGIAVLRFDFTGLGESEGDFADTTFSSNVDDLVSAAEYLKSEFKSPTILIGHSLGGAAVILASHNIDSAKAVVTIGAPYDPEHVKHLLKEGLDEIKEKGEAEVSIGGRPFKIKNKFLEDLENRNMQDKIRHLRKALLIMHSPQDLIVTIDNAKKIYLDAVHSKSFVSLDEADHLLSNKKDSLYAGEIISTWAKKYIDIPDEKILKTEKRVLVRTGESYTTDIKAGNHHLTADEPESVGGSDFGPTPYDLLVAGLGACTSMTLRMYADRKKWDVKEIKVHLQHSKDYAEDCDNCDKPSSKIDKIERVIEVEGDLNDEQRSRLIEIANKCPVHRTLHSDIHIDTKLKG